MGRVEMWCGCYVLFARAQLLLLSSEGRAAKIKTHARRLITAEAVAAGIALGEYSSHSMAICLMYLRVHRARHEGPCSGSKAVRCVYAYHRVHDRRT